MLRNILSFLVGCALVVAIATVPRVSHAAGHGKVGQELMQSERNRCTATVKNDVAALGAILADDIIDVWPNGKITTKAQDLADAKLTRPVLARWT
jgi:hypothetical protein